MKRVFALSLFLICLFPQYALVARFVSITSETSSVKASTPTKIPTPTKTNSTSINLVSSSAPNGQTSSNSDKIAQNFKIASDFARIRNQTPTKARGLGSVRVLGIKDQTTPPWGILTIIGGLILFLGARGWLIYKNLDQVKYG